MTYIGGASAFVRSGGNSTLGSRSRRRRQTVRERLRPLINSDWCGSRVNHLAPLPERRALPNDYRCRAAIISRRIISKIKNVNTTAPTRIRRHRELLVTCLVHFAIIGNGKAIPIFLGIFYYCMAIFFFFGDKFCRIALFLFAHTSCKLVIITLWCE